MHQNDTKNFEKQYTQFIKPRATQNHAHSGNYGTQNHAPLTPSHSVPRPELATGDVDPGAASTRGHEPVALDANVQVKLCETYKPETYSS